MSHTSESSTTTLVAARLALSGRVQGIGLRPAVARFAEHLRLTGYVSNTLDGVEIHVEGAEQDVERFERDLSAHLPAAAAVEQQRAMRVDPLGCEVFHVGQGLNEFAGLSGEMGKSGAIGPTSARVPPDVVVCESCLAEIGDALNRRHSYAFTSCTDCGPRYSILDRMPYERGSTTMAAFELCGECRDEYQSPTDRRFHAQTNACPQCGPQIWLRNRASQTIGRGQASIQQAAAALLQGRIIALRGLGGYQLLVDATSEEAVERLRRRKERRGKPLAVMVGSLAEAKQLSHLSETERQWLAHPSGPILVAELRLSAPVAPSVTAGLGSIGLMLPSTPLHALLLQAAGRALVCTSGNSEGDPLAYEADAALADLGDVADLWLEHDRPIRRPIDDSVVRVMAGRPVAIRLGRGLAPRPLELESVYPLAALGGHQKSSIALYNGAQAVLGPHIGDLATLAARQRYTEQVAALQELYGIDEVMFACDWHPEYFTSQWADAQNRPVVRVQHHHAHIAAGMLEHGWLDRQVLGVSFDGTGYGGDGSIWGGEFLLATASGFERVGRLRPFPLAGGERAVRQPWRVATALVQATAGGEAASRLLFQSGDPAALLPILQRPSLAIATTSAGRLFDGLAALVLGVEECEFEGQAAMLLEAACDSSAPGMYPIRLSDYAPVELDWRPLVRAVLRERAAGIAPGTIAIRCHRGIAQAIVDLCSRYTPLPVVLGGGVFQNRVLVELLAASFLESGQEVGLPGLLPPNDGGLAAGQLVVASSLSRLGRNKKCV